MRSLDLLYQLPRPLERIDDYYRERHEDLPHFSVAELWREFHKVDNRIAWQDSGEGLHWLCERFDAVLAELRRRRSGGSRP